MAINHNEIIKGILNAAKAMKDVLVRLKNSSEFNTKDLVDSMTTFQAIYGQAARSYTSLGAAGMTAQQVADAFGLQVFPAPTPSSTFNAIGQARNALVATYDSDVWPLFNGVTQERVSSNHVLKTITKPASFDSALQNMITALEALVE